MQFRTISTIEEFAQFQKELGVRKDWHEPDEVGVTVKVRGKKFDNAGFDDEKFIEFYKDRKLVAEVNLATFCSFPCAILIN